jgi:hypothetical protein
MKDKYTPPHPKTLEEIERDSIPSLVEVPREEGIDVVRQVLRDVTGWPRDYSPPACTYRATEEQKRTGWEMVVECRKDRRRGTEETHDFYIILGEAPYTEGSVISNSAAGKPN